MGKGFSDILLAIGVDTAQLEKGIAQAKRSLDGLEAAADRAGKRIKGSLSGTGGVGGSGAAGGIGGFADSLRSIDTSAIDALFGVIVRSALSAKLTIEGMIGVILSVGGAFEAQMTAVASVSGAMGDDLQKLTDKARELGEQLPITATNAGQAMYQLASAGLRVDEITKAVESVASLSIGQGYSMDQTADLMVTALRSFELEASDSARVADVFTNAVNMSMLTMEKISMAFPYAATQAKMLGVSLEDTVAAMEALSERGLRGSQIGTWLGQVFNGLSTNSKGVQELSKKYGVSFFDANGKAKDLLGTFVELGKRGATMSDFLAAFNDRGGKAAAILAETGDRLLYFRDGLNASGKAAGMLDERMKTFPNRMQELKSSIEESYLVGFDQIRDQSKGVVDALTQIVRAANAWMKDGNIFGTAVESFMTGMGLAIPSAEEFSSILGTITADDVGSWFGSVGNTVGALGNAFITLASAVPWKLLADHMTAFANVVILLWAGKKILSLGLMVEALAQNFIFFATALAANPIAATILGIAVAVGGAVIAYKTLSDSMEEAAKKARETAVASGAAENALNPGLSEEEISRRSLAAEKAISRLNAQREDAKNRGDSGEVSRLDKLIASMGIEIDTLNTSLSLKQKLAVTETAMATSIDMVTDATNRRIEAEKRFQELEQTSKMLQAQYGVSLPLEEGELLVEKAKEAEGQALARAKAEAAIRGGSLQRDVGTDGKTSFSFVDELQVDKERLANLDEQLAGAKNAYTAVFSEGTKEQIDSARKSLDALQTTRDALFEKVEAIRLATSQGFDSKAEEQRIGELSGKEQAQQKKILEMAMGARDLYKGATGGEFAPSAEASFYEKTLQETKAKADKAWQDVLDTRDEDAIREGLFRLAAKAQEHGEVALRTVAESFAAKLPDELKYIGAQVDSVIQDALSKGTSVSAEAELFEKGKEKAQAIVDGIVEGLSSGGQDVMRDSQFLNGMADAATGAILEAAQEMGKGFAPAMQAAIASDVGGNGVRLREVLSRISEEELSKALAAGGVSDEGAAASFLDSMTIGAPKSLTDEEAGSAVDEGIARAREAYDTLMSRMASAEDSAYALGTSLDAALGAVVSGFDEEFGERLAAILESPGGQEVSAVFLEEFYRLGSQSGDSMVQGLAEKLTNVPDVVASRLNSLTSSVGSVLGAVGTSGNAETDMALLDMAYEKVEDVVAAVHELVSVKFSTVGEDVREAIEQSLIIESMEKIGATWESVWNRIMARTREMPEASSLIVDAINQGAITGRDLERIKKDTAEEARAQLPVIGEALFQDEGFRKLTPESQRAVAVLKGGEFLKSYPVQSDALAKMSEDEIYAAMRRGFPTTKTPKGNGGYIEIDGKRSYFGEGDDSPRRRQDRPSKGGSGYIESDGKRSYLGEGEGRSGALREGLKDAEGKGSSLEKVLANFSSKCAELLSGLKTMATSVLRNAGAVEMNTVATKENTAAIQKLTGVFGAGSPAPVAPIAPPTLGPSY